MNNMSELLNTRHHNNKSETVDNQYYSISEVQYIYIKKTIINLVYKTVDSCKMLNY